MIAQYLKGRIACSFSKLCPKQGIKYLLRLLNNICSRDHAMFCAMHPSGHAPFFQWETAAQQVTSPLALGQNSARSLASELSFPSFSVVVANTKSGL